MDCVDSEPLSPLSPRQEPEASAVRGFVQLPISERHGLQCSPMESEVSPAAPEPEQPFIG